MVLYFIKDSLSIIFDYINSIIWFLPRITVCLSIFPFFSQVVISNFIRQAIAVALALIPSASYVNAVDAKERTFIELSVFAIHEVFFGLILGLIVSIPFFILRFTGAFIDAWRGATFSTLIDPTSGNDELPIEKLLGYTYSLLFFSGPSIILAINCVYDSFLIIPPGITSYDVNDGLLHFAINELSKTFYFAVILGGPVLIAIMLAELALAVISVYSPALSVYSIEMAFKSVAAIAMLLVTFEFASDEIMRISHEGVFMMSKTLLRAAG